MKTLITTAAIVVLFNFTSESFAQPAPTMKIGKETVTVRYKLDKYVWYSTFGNDFAPRKEMGRIWACPTRADFENGFTVKGTDAGSCIISRGGRTSDKSSKQLNELWDRISLMPPEARGTEAEFLKKATQIVSETKYCPDGFSPDKVHIKEVMQRPAIMGVECKSDKAPSCAAGYQLIRSGDGWQCIKWGECGPQFKPGPDPSRCIRCVAGGCIDPTKPEFLCKVNAENPSDLSHCSSK
jgi:hypothetical protein